MRAFMAGLALGVIAGLLCGYRWGAERPGNPDDEIDFVPLPESPSLHGQDALLVDGEVAIHPPPGTELIQRGWVQG